MIDCFPNVLVRYEPCVGEEKILNLRIKLTLSQLRHVNFAKHLPPADSSPSY
jgi:hypothetical protein